MHGKNKIERSIEMNNAGTLIGKRLQQMMSAIFHLVIAVALLTAIDTAHATVRQPNGEYQETMEDLSVKVLGGAVRVTRTWQADDLNKGEFRWYVNPNWADLTFRFDSIDGSVKQITRSGSQFTKTGSGVFVFDEIYFIKQTTSPAGWRWYDPQGNWITYEASGKITGYGDRNNIGVSFSRNGDGTLNQLKDQNNAVVLTYQYTGGQVTQISDNSGRRVSYQYSGNVLSQVTDALGYRWTYTYTGGLLTGKTDANGNRTAITYSGNRVVRISDPLGYETNYSYSYDHFKRVYTTVETSPTNVRTETRYDANGKVMYQQIGTRVVSQRVKDGSNVEIEIDERGLQTRTVYDTRRNPTQVTYPDGTTTSATYDAIYGNVTSRTDELGIQTQYAYDAKGNLTKLTEAVGYPEERITTYTYDSQGQRLTQTIKGLPIPEGTTPGPNATQYQDATTTWTYDANGNVASATDALGQTTAYTYDVMGNVQTRKDARGYTTRYEHNARGWLTSQTDALTHRTTVGYDKVGNRTSVTDALNNITTYAFNADDRLTSVTDALGGVSTQYYDNSGRLTKACDQSEVCIGYSYDGDGRLTTTTDGANNVTQQQYGDAVNGLKGLLATTVYPTYTMQYKYDARGRRTQTIKALPGTNGQADQQLITTNGYDAMGRAISVTDQMNHTKLTSYDALGRQTKTTDALAGVTNYAYDTRNNLLSVTDANNHAHHFVHDLVGRTSSEGRPMGETIQYAYDEVGNLTTRTSPKGDRRVYIYDGAGRRTREDHYPAGSNTTSQGVAYTYDERDQITGYIQIGDTQSSASYTYDANGQKKTETVSYGSGQAAFSKAIQYDYYPNGQKQFFTYPDNTVVTFGYTANHLLASVTTPGTNTIQFTNFVWNTPTQVQLPGVVRNIMLDPLQRPTEIKAQALGTGAAEAPNGALVMDYQYTYDAAGNITKRTTEDGEYAYTYDNLDQLTGATPPTNVQVSPTNPNGLPIEQYTYDAVHNRISSAHQAGPWTYNADNQLQHYGTGANQISYTFDANGNTSEQKTGDPNTPGTVRTFIYNAAERLAEVDDNGSVIATYQYDPLGRRIQKQINGLIIWYQYADEGLIAEYAENGSLARAYGWRPQGTWGTDPLWLADVTGTGWAVYYYQNDYLGTPQRLTDSVGEQLWKGTAEAYGRTYENLTNAILNNLRFPGQYYDLETKSNYNFHRQYSFITARYNEIDLLARQRYSAPYSYVSNNPLSFIDFSGLIKWETDGNNDGGGNTIVCDGNGGILPLINDPYEGDCSLYLNACLFVHESVHKAHASAVSPDLCKMVPAGTQIVVVGEKDSDDEEKEAYRVEKRCLDNIIDLLNPCDECKKRIRKRINCVSKYIEVGPPNWRFDEHTGGYISRICSEEPI